MRKLLTILLLGTFISSTNASNTNSNKVVSTNYPSIKIETNSNWRIEAEKYPLYPCADIILKERNAQYFGNKYK